MAALAGRHNLTAHQWVEVSILIGTPMLWGFLLQSVAIAAGGMLTVAVWGLLFDINMKWHPAWQRRPAPPQATEGKGVA